MASNTAVMVRAGAVHLVIFAGFARTPQTGDHVMLWPSKEQLAQLGSAFGFGHDRGCLPGIVRATVLREEAQWQRNRGTSAVHPLEDHVADIFVEAISTEEWTEHLRRWTALGEY